MSASESEPLSSLSPREQEIAMLVCSSGLSNKAIANRLGLTEGTVKHHVHNILAKLGARNRGQLIVLMRPPRLAIRA